MFDVDSRFYLKEGWATFFIGLAMIWTSAYAFHLSEIIDGLIVLSQIGTIAYISGYLLAKSRFGKGQARLISMVYAVFVIVWLLGGRFLDPALDWIEQFTTLFERQLIWIEKAIGGGTSRDALIFPIQTGVLFWVLGHTAAWYTFRDDDKKLWRVVLPSGITLLSIVYYYFGPRQLWVLLVIYILLAFLYIARMYLAEEQSVWTQTVVRYEKSISQTFLMGGLVVALVALLGAWSLPPLTASTAVNNAVRRVDGPVERIQDNWQRLFSSLRSYGQATTDAYTGQLSLGGPRNVAETLIMDVYVEEKLPFAYWQAIVYEGYYDGEWSSPTGDRALWTPDEVEIFVPNDQSRDEVTVTVANYIPNAGTLYGMPQIVGSDQQLFVTSQINNQGENLVSKITSRYVLAQGETYDVTSRVSVATGNQLRTAGTTYPTWVDPYLQVPDSLTPRTLDLAEELIAPTDNPYDAAVSVQNFLREHITYNDQIAAPPDNVEPIDYVLFDLKEGYCNYYATSMVMMLRSQGIPARMVAGYASGDFVDDANVYRVRARDAHTWAEVYFPEYGWVQFEPTSAIPVFTRPDGADPLSNADEPAPSLADLAESQQDREALLPENEDQEDFNPEELDLNRPEEETVSLWLRLTQNVAFVIGFIGVLVMGAAMALLLRYNRQVESDVQLSYARLGIWAGWLGRPFESTLTPFERADALSELVPVGKRPIRRLTAQYVHLSYGRKQMPDPNFEPRLEWQLLRPVLFREAIKVQTERLKNRIRRR